jgi:hypothetical protein
MIGLAILGLIVAAVAALDVAAVTWGVDSRTGFDGSEHTGRRA